MMVRPQIPLKFKVKNLNSKKWAHDLEVEVTNTSERPIYFFHFFISLPEIKGLAGNTYAFWMHYGRGKLVDFSTPLEKYDVPLLPGEKYTFKLAEGIAKGWDYMREKEGRPEPTRIVIQFQSINFGDGTGYDDVKRVDIRKKINFNKTCVPPPHRFPDSSTLLAFSFLPASFLPVKYFVAEKIELLSRTTLPIPDICGCAGDCKYVKATFTHAAEPAIQVMMITPLKHLWVALTQLVDVRLLRPKSIPVLTLTVGFRSLVQIPRYFPALLGRI